MEGNLVDFLRSTSCEPHGDRAREILETHPEIRRHFGKNPWSALLIVMLVPRQTVLAAWIQHPSWCALLLTSYLVGAFAIHALLVLLHECAHKLIFDRSSLNMLAAITAALPSLLVNGVTWPRYHVKHHR